MELKDLFKRNNKPFPEIVVDKQNKQWAGMLKNLYAGCFSETVAFLQYLYQSYITRINEPQISDMLMAIVEDEMEHHEQLAMAIIKLGGNPFYENAGGMVLPLVCVSNSQNLRDMLRRNISLEERAISEYKNVADRIDNDSIKELLNRIVEDEELHRMAFEQILEYVNFYK